MNFDFHYETSNNPIMAYRITYPGMTVRVGDNEKAYPVPNISSTGIALADVCDKIRKGEIVKLTILLNGHVFLAGLEAQVMHVDKAKNFAGLEYHNVTRPQEQKLDIFILKLQKLEIQRHRANLLAAKKKAESGE